MFQLQLIYAKYLASKQAIVLIKGDILKYLIIGDSSTNLSPEECERIHAKMAPLSIRIEGIEYTDDRDLDIPDFVKKLTDTEEVAKSSCPSTQSYIDLFSGDYDNIFVITLSSKLSGSYNSAMLAKTLYQEKHPEKNIHVFDSRAAATTQYMLALKIHELAEEGADFNTVVKKGEEYLDSTQLLFILGNIKNMYKNGRMTMIQAKLANILNLKLILKQNKEGYIDLAGKARGTKKTIAKMVKSMAEYKKILTDTKIVIFHCQALDKAKLTKELIEKYYGEMKDISIIEMYGLNSTYAQKGGIILTF